MDKQQRRDKNPHKTKHIQKRNDTARIPGAAIENTLEKCGPAGENDTAKAAMADSTFDQYEPASKIEDAAMKTAAQFLGEELLPYLKVTGRMSGWKKLTGAWRTEDCRRQKNYCR